MQLQQQQKRLYHHHLNKPIVRCSTSYNASRCTTLHRWCKPIFAKFLPRNRSTNIVLKIGAAVTVVFPKRTVPTYPRCCARPLKHFTLFCWFRKNSREIKITIISLLFFCIYMVKVKSTTTVGSDCCNNIQPLKSHIVSMLFIVVILWFWANDVLSQRPYTGWRHTARREVLLNRHTLCLLWMTVEKLRYKNK